MSINTTWINWIEQCIKEKHTKYYEYKKFNNITKIGSGRFGQVYKANWKQKDVALKSFDLDNSTVKEIVSELKSYREIGFHDNIIQFYGITTKTDSDKEYLLVLEYADGGTLRNYLEKNFSSLNWQDKYKLAFQLSIAIECLHDEEVVHRDLHSKNILIHQGSVKLADFGLSKRIEDATKPGSSLFDVIPYIDPKLFNNARKKSEVILLEDEREKYKKNDVYGVGVLFWELSSGKKPFDDYVYDLSLAVNIAGGLRESIVEGTPEEYSNLYMTCWDGDPDKRLTMKQVVSTLELMISLQDLKSETPQFSTIIEERNNTSPNNEPHQSQLINRFHLLNTNDLGSLTTTIDGPPSKIDGVLISEFITLFIKLTDEGKTRRPILDEYLSSHDVTIEEIHEWLNHNYMTDPSYIFCVGYLSISGMGTTLNFNKAFYYFHRASLQHHPTAQYYLGICHEFGLGTTIDKSSAFKCYEKSAKLGQSIAGKYSLGVCYENGIGIEKDNQSAFYWYQEAANNGHAIAQHYLGNCYRLGIYFKQDYNIAFHYYKLSADGKYSSGINMLGVCYSKGSGISADKKIAFELYFKAANMNNYVAQYNVAVCFDYGVGTTKDFNKAMEWYKKSADNGYDKAIDRLDVSTTNY